MYARSGLKHLAYDVPTHAQSLPYMLGGLALACFGMLILSGIYIAQFYNPNQVGSNTSIMYLISQAPFGNFVRSVHYWAATLVFVIILLHLVRVFISGSYKRPREFTWLTGLGLLMVTIGYIFTGTMLNLSQEGLEALEHNSEAGLLMGKLGEWFTSGFSPTIPLVGRVYVAHMTILTACFVALIVAHMFFIKVHGMSPKATRDAKATTKKGTGAHFDEHIVRLAGWSFILFAGIALLALIRPESLGGPGVLGVEATKPPWMFLWIFGFENLFGIQALLWGPALVFTVLAAIPFIDRSPYLSPIRRWRIMLLGVVIVGALVALSVNAARTPMEMPKESGFLPRTMQGIGAFIFPVAHAHGLASVTFKPVELTPGATVTVSADGLKVEGDYEIFLKGDLTTREIGVGTVDKGDDMFDADLVVPKDLPGGSYTVEARSVKDHQVDIFSPLQLVVHAVADAQMSDMPQSTTYPIPRSELPWIVGLVVISFGFGAGLLLLTRKS